MGPQPAAEMRGRKRCSFLRSPGGQADGRAHTHFHTSLSHPVVPAHFERVFGNLYAHVGIKTDGHYGEAFPLWLKFS